MAYVCTELTTVHACATYMLSAETETDLLPSTSPLGDATTNLSLIILRRGWAIARNPYRCKTPLARETWGRATIRSNT